MDGSRIRAPVRRPLRRREPSVHIGVGLHRDVRGGGLRASIFGLSDGLVSNVSLVLGTSAAHPGPGIVRLAGLAGLFGGAFSMAAGEYVSMRGQREALERELDVERSELAEHPMAERTELEHIYRERGVTHEVASLLADQLMCDPDTALETHAREELGIDTASLGSPVQASVSSFVSFGFGALIPLIPFLSGSATTGAVVVAIVLSAIAAVLIGIGLAVFTSRSWFRSALRSLVICGAAGGVTYAIGSIIGLKSGT
jgi:VIT1/CCC1 family predicted Fe2+/Mn2+ transporter